MQTFLPYSDFIKSAKCLDYKRLGKQRVEAWQIYNALKQGEYTYKNCPYCQGLNVKLNCKKCNRTTRIKRKTAWYNHPITRMWRNYEQALLKYGLIICREWIKRGYKDTMEERFLRELVDRGVKDVKYPKWLGNKKLHASHRSNLLRKDKEYYSRFGWKEPDNLEYVWIK